jgi:hypothetical protein
MSRSKRPDVDVPEARREALAVRKVGGETLVYDLLRHRAHCLEEVVAAVWRHSDGERAVAEIARRAAADAGRPVGADEVAVALVRLQRAHLLESGFVARMPSRREWLKKAAGLSGLAIVSIAAPTPVEAATCIPLATCEGPAGASASGCTTNVCCPGPGVNAGARCCRQGSGPCQCRVQGACSN